MLLALSELRSFQVLALDGEAGSIHDFYIDDATWRVTHAVIATGSWLLSRKVLVRVQDMGVPDLRQSQFRLALPQDLIKALPAVETAAAQHTMSEFAEWLVEGPGADPGGAPDYRISDFLAQGCWRIRYICIEAGDLISPRKRAVPVQRLAPPHAEERKLETPLVKTVIQNGPEMGGLKRVNRALELKLEKYYASFG